MKSLGSLPQVQYQEASAFKPLQLLQESGAIWQNLPHYQNENNSEHHQMSILHNPKS